MLVQDAMACCRVKGKPTLFITMTTNPEWDEIKENLLPGQTAVNRPDITSRVFAGKLQSLLNDLDKGEFFGAVDAMVHVVEYQKRGLPHAHILLILKPDDRPRCGDDYDTIVSAEIPDKDADPGLYDIVKACMIHGPCGPLKPDAPCTEDKKCKKHVPMDFQEETVENRDGYPQYRRYIMNACKMRTVFTSHLLDIIPYACEMCMLTHTSILLPTML